MHKKKTNEITIAVTCVGSGVAQSIVNSLRSSSLNTRIVGLGNNMFAFGLYDCDVHDYLPAIYSPDYRDCLLAKCKEYGVDIILPGLDDDARILSESGEWFQRHGMETLVSGPMLVSACRNKVGICNTLHGVTDSFCESFTPDNFEEALADGKIQYPFIAKPSDGSGSQGVHIIHDAEYHHLIAADSCIQELVAPRSDDPCYQEFWRHVDKGVVSQVSEVSVQLVTSREGELIGRMATCNRLKNGVPIEILPFDNDELWREIDKLVPALRAMGMRGPMNIQGRITDAGVKFFEVNPRFTGITGLRAMMGFNEVEICVRNWLGLPIQSTFFEPNRSKFGLRQVADKVIPIDSEPRVKAFCDLLNHGGRRYSKVLLMTGATGYLGRGLIEELARRGIFRLWVLSRDKQSAQATLGSQVEAYFDYEDLFGGMLPLGNVDVLLHAGFARPGKGEQAIAESLAFSNELFRLAGLNNIPSILNISSQSVYGRKTPTPWTESTPAAPATPYASAKYASEIMLLTEKRLQQHLNITSIRLGTLTGAGPGIIPVGVVTWFVEKALRGEDLVAYAGHQCQRLDVRDAVAGIVRLLDMPHQEWKPLYNFSHTERYALTEVAEMVLESVKSATGHTTSQIRLDTTHGTDCEGMDSTLLFGDIDWCPRYSLGDSIRSLIDSMRETIPSQGGSSYSDCL